MMIFSVKYHPNDDDEKKNANWFTLFKNTFDHLEKCEANIPKIFA